MARLYIVNPDGPGLYTWDFQQVPWFEHQLVLWMTRRTPYSRLIWAGFLNGVQQVMERRLSVDRSWDRGPVEYEPAEGED